MDVDGGSDERGEIEAIPVDLTLIAEMLRMTPSERLRQNDRMTGLAVRLREAFELGRPPWLIRET